MCIRDRHSDAEAHPGHRGSQEGSEATQHRGSRRRLTRVISCLLYTSDAADERSSVDLGGRRIIKKKKQRRHDNSQEQIQINTHDYKEQPKKQQ